MDVRLSEIFITHVGDEGPLLKIWGQTDRTIPANIERLIGQLTLQFNQGNGVPSRSSLSLGQLCCAQYSDGTYYRARITSLANLHMDKVTVQFADYGNLEVITLSNIRVLDGFMTPLATCADQAVHFYLANIAPLTGDWSSQNLRFIKDTICYMDLKFASVGKVANHHFIRVQLPNGVELMDLGDFLASRRIGVNILLETQIGILHSIINKIPLPQMQLWPRFNPDVPPPLPLAQMMVTQSTAQAVEENVMNMVERRADLPQLRSAPGMLPKQGSAHSAVKPPSSLLVYPGRDAYGVAPGHASVSPPAETPAVVPYAAYPEPRRPPTVSPPATEVAIAGFEVRRLTLNKPYNVRVVYVENGPESFIVFLLDMEAELSKMLADLNSHKPMPLSAPPMIGTICLGRSSDSSLLRAVVIQVGDMCKLYFVDFGTTEEVAYDDIYAIPPHYVANPKPMCVRFTHGGLNTFDLTKDIKDVFASMVSGKCFTLFVTASDGHHLKQFGILFEDGKSVLNMVKMHIDSEKHNDYQSIPALTVGSTKSIMVAYIESMKKFYVLLEDDQPTLQALMQDIAAHCSLTDPTYFVTRLDLREGLLCCALFAEDKQWYRAKVQKILPQGVQVYYVDYGNSEMVDVGSLRHTTPELVTKLKAQAIECCLSGYEDVCSEDDVVITRFSELVVDKTLIAYVVKHTTSGKPVVNLHDLAATPLLSVGTELATLKKPQSEALARNVHPQPLAAEKSFRSGDDAKQRGTARFYEGNQRERSQPSNRDSLLWRTERGKSCIDVDWRARPDDNQRGDRTGTSRPERQERSGANREERSFGNREERSTGSRDERSIGSREERSMVNRNNSREDKIDTWEGSQESKSSERGFPPPPAKTGDVKAAQLVFTENPEDFYVQITPDIALTDIMTDIAALYGSGGGRALSQMSRGVPCIAQYSEDNEWYRGLVQSADSRSAKVMFVDYGNVDDVPLASVKEIVPAFLSFPAQAVRCCLSGSLPKGSTWSTDEITAFTELLDGKPLEVKFGTERNGIFSVTVTDGESGDVINTKFGGFVEAAPLQSYNKPAQSYNPPAQSYNPPAQSYNPPAQSYNPPAQSYNPPAVKPAPPSAAPPPEKTFRKEPTFQPKPAPPPPPPQVFAQPDERLKAQTIAAETRSDVGITWFISPEQFYVSLAASAGEFDKMMRELQTAYRNTRPNTDGLAVGGPVVAKFKEDDSFCRAEVTIMKNPHSYVVQYADYGNCDLLAKGDLFPVESKFLGLAKQAVLCSLSEVRPTAAEWPKVSDDIDALFRNEKYQCTFHEEVEGKYLVSLSYKGSDVAESLVAKGLAVRPPPPVEITVPAIQEEAIEKPLLVGQALKANVTHVEGVSKFFVHLDGNRAVEIQALVDAFVLDPKNKRAFPAEQVEIGKMCIASSDGKQWFRAAIIDCTGTAGIFVTFVDYGDGDEVPADKMIPIPAELAAFPAQAVECRLAGSSGADVSDEVEEGFKAGIEKQSVLIHVDDITDDRLSVSVYSLDGKKLELVAGIGTGPAALPPICPLPILTQKPLVFVSHADDPANVWLQKAAEADTLAELLESLYTFYEVDKSGAAIPATAGLICAAKAVDEQWYRAEVLSTVGIVDVRFVDYGNVEAIDAANVKALDASFVEQHVMAVRVSLPVKNDAEKNVDLVAMTAEVEYVAAFARNAAGGWVAELFHKKETFSDALLELGFALVDEYPFDEAKEQVTRSPKLVPGLELAVFVSHVGSPAEIWVQYGCNVADIEQMQETLQVAAEALKDLTVPVVGDICAATYSEDSSWYRAVVLKVNDSAATVRFVDYGNTDVVDVLTKPLKVLSKKLAAVEFYAVSCSLNVSPIDREFSSEVTERINVLVAEDTSPLLLTVVKDGNVVDLLANGKSVFETLTEEALVIEHYDPASVFVSHVNGPTEFWIQYQSSTFQLEAMSERMTESAEFDPLPEAKAGVLCAAKFVDDDAWYRARVTGQADEGTAVHFVDFGNSAVATELRELPEDLLVISPVAKRCRLVGADKLAGAAAERFEELAGFGETSFLLEIVTLADPVVVELVLDGKKVGEMLAKISDGSGAKLDVAAKETKREPTEDVTQARDIAVIKPDVQKEDVCSEAMHGETSAEVDASSPERQVVEDENEAVGGEIQEEETASEVVEVSAEERLVETVDDDDDAAAEDRLSTEGNGADADAVDDLEAKLSTEDAAATGAGVTTAQANNAARNDRPEEVTHAQKDKAAITAAVSKNKMPDQDDCEISAAFCAAAPAKVLQQPRSRPHTPHDQKIVPGSICRGISDDELAKSVATEEELRRELEAEVEAASAQAAPCRSPLPRRAVESQSCPGTPIPRPPTPSRLTHNERIVPGSISCSTSAEDVSDGKKVSGSSRGPVKARQRSLEEPELGQGEPAGGTVAEEVNGVNGKH